MQWSCHVQVLLVVAGNIRNWRRIDRVSLALHDRLVLDVIGGLSGLFDCGRHLHLSFEVQLRLLVALLAILQFLVSPVDQVVAGSNVIVSIVLNAFLGVFPFELEFLDNLVE